jgi:tRNA dimethylallyltransferase
LNYLITIIGPTAIGKTALSIALAKHFNCDILSCDSRQFFKEMTIGTAVPTPEELQQVQHHFIQHISIFEKYTVGDFERDALDKLNYLFSKNKIQIMVGGSGLYVDAVLKGFDEFPEIDASVREELNTQFEQKGISFLQEKLKNVDPEYYSKLEVENPQTLENPQRLKRFVEVSVATGKPYSSFLNQKQNTRNFTPIIIGLQADRTIMYDRINQRVELMIENKLIDEALQLHPHQELNALQTVGYRELFQYFNHTIDLPTAIEEIMKNTRRFAKRQITWFKRTENAIWFDYNSQIQDIISKMDDLMK